MKAVQLVCSEEFVYALNSDKSLEKLNAEDWSAPAIVKSVKAPGAGALTALALHGNELWVGDDAGGVYVLDADTLEPLQHDGALIELKTEKGKGVQSMAVSASYVASGGTDGVVTVYDRAARTKKCYFPVHNHK